MKKSEIFTFTAPNGVEVTAVVINKLRTDYRESTDTIVRVWLCYAQNRLFTYFEEIGRKNACTPEEEEFVIKAWYGTVIVDYCILPDYDDMLEAKQQKFNDDRYNHEQYWKYEVINFQQ